MDKATCTLLLYVHVYRSEVIYMIVHCTCTVHVHTCMHMLNAHPRISNCTYVLLHVYNWRSLELVWLSTVIQMPNTDSYMYMHSVNFSVLSVCSAGLQVAQSAVNREGATGGN